MKVIEPKFEIVDDLNGVDLLKRIEAAGRTCYKSEAKITHDSAINFVKRIIKSGHESVIEHEKISVRITCSRRNSRNCAPSPSQLQSRIYEILQLW